MNIFERIKKVAHLRGLSLREVAIKAGFKSETGIYRYNQGVTPRDSTLQSIADVLNTTVDYLKGKTEDINPISKTYFRIDTSGLNNKEIDSLYKQLNSEQKRVRQILLKHRNKA